MNSGIFDMLKRVLRDNSTIARNTGYLTVIECVHIFLPFVALPYVIRTIGMELYGTVAFAQTLVQYFLILINFGLDISAVKDVSVNRHDSEALGRIVSTVLGVKVLLLAFSSLLLAGGMFAIPFMREQRLLMAFAFLTCLTEVLFPVWFYQGIEKMKYITLVRAGSILFYTVSVFLFVRGAGDYRTVALLQSLGNVAAGCVSFYCLLRIEKVSLVLPTAGELCAMFRQSIPFWFSRVSVVFNTNLAKTVSGLFFTMESVAAFELAQRITNGVLIPTRMLNQAAYPHVARTRDRRFVGRFLLLNIVTAALTATAVCATAPWLIRLFAGGEAPQAVALLRIFCLYAFSCCITICMGSTMLVAFGHPGPFNASVIWSTLVLVLAYAALYAAGAFTIYNFALAIVAADVFVLLYRFCHCRRYGIIRFNGEGKE